MLSKEQIAYFDKNPEMVSTADLRELIAILRESQKDAALWQYAKGCIEYRNSSEWLENAVQVSTTGYEFESRLLAEMKHDCDGSHHIVDANEMVKDSEHDPLTFKNAITYTP